MKKRVFVIILAMCLICSSLAFAQEGVLFDVIKYDFKLFWNGNELEFDSPVLLVNGQTYVPLRDMAEETGMDVNWNGDTREIRMTEADVWFEDVFFDALGFEIPLTAEVVNYAYGRYGRDISLHAKIFFKESDLEYIKEGLDNIAAPLSSDEMNEFGDTIVFSNLSKKFDWWDIFNAENAQYAYFGFMEGYESSTINVWGLICGAPDLDGYYLYILC